MRAYHRHQDHCRGKWKEHGKIELTSGSNNNETTWWIFKKCLRCHRTIFFQYFDSRDEFRSMWTELRRRELTEVSKEKLLELKEKEK